MARVWKTAGRYGFTLAGLLLCTALAVFYYMAAHGVVSVHGFGRLLIIIPYVLGLLGTAAGSAAAGWAFGITMLLAVCALCDYARTVRRRVPADIS
jgi:hypothetical protein